MYQNEVEDEVEDKPNRCKVCLYYTWKLISTIISHIFLVSLVIAYCYLGAYIFGKLESENEIEVKKTIPSIRRETMDDIWNMTKNADVLNQTLWMDYVRNSVQNFEKRLLSAMKKDGWDGTEDLKASQWTFTGSLFYSIIVITTIGYGHIAPKTPWGKVVTIFYAILGIPLMLLCLSNIGDIMAHSFRFLYWRVCCYMCTRKPKRRPSRKNRSRGTVRSASGGRSANRRTQSFRYPVRTSTRSADSALGLSLSAYSDSESRYYEERDGNVEGNQLRSSQHSRYSDSAVPVRTGDIITPQGSEKSRGTREKSRSRPPPETTQPDPPTPVLINKYALDRDESMKAQRPTKYQDDTYTLPRHKSNYTESQYQSSPYAGSLRRQLEVDNYDTPHSSTRSAKRASPRIMTPMGFVVPRQPSQRNRLSRVREGDDFYEEEYYSDDNSNGKVKPVPIWLCVCLVISYIIGGAFLFQKWENWRFVDAAYFCFITLTTIGFGDFVPAQREDNAEISIALCSLYLLFGIALLAMSFNLVQEEVINNVKAVAKRLGIIKDDEDDD